MILLQEESQSMILHTAGVPELAEAAVEIVGQLLVIL